MPAHVRPIAPDSPGLKPLKLDLAGAGVLQQIRAFSPNPLLTCVVLQGILNHELDAAAWQNVMELVEQQ